MTRRSAGAVLALILALFTGSAASAAEASTSAAGTAETSVELATLTVAGLAVDLTDVSLGALRSFASTDGDAARNVLGNGQPFALADIVLPGQQSVSARSDGANNQPGRSVALPGGAGSLTVGTLDAVANATEARSVIDALSGQVDAVLTGLTVAIPESGASALVDTTAATATNGAVLEDFALGLDDILPSDLLSELPLGTLLALVDGLPLDASALEGVVGQLEAVLTDLEQLESVTGQVDGVVDQLQGALAPLEQVLSTGGVVDAALVDQVVGDLTALQDGPLAALTDDVEAVLPGLLDTAEGLLAADITALIDELLAGLAGLDIVAVDQVSAGVSATASETASAGTANCAVEGVRVLGQALPEVGTCAELTEQLAGVRSTLLDLLSGLPVVGEVVETVVTLEGPTTSTSAPNATDGGYHVASAAIDGLLVGVNSLDLEAVTDSLLSDLLATLGGLLGGDLEALLGGDLGNLVDGATSDLVDELLSGGLDGLVTDLTGLVGGLTDVLAEDSASGSSDSNLTEPVTDVIAEVGTIGGDGLLRSLPPGVSLDSVLGTLGGLEDVLGLLPLGDGLLGLQTPALSLEALGLNATSSFNAAGVPGVPSVNPPAAQVPTPAGNLPRTGGGVALALVLLGTGAGAVRWLRRSA